MDREITFAVALREAISEEMKRDQNVFLLGEDIKYSVWGVTGGLNKEFGDDRVLHTPISENGFISAAIGAALIGTKPVVELMYSDFLILAADSVINEAAKYRYMCGGGKFKVPITIRAAGAGTGTGSGLHHSQSVEATFIHYPGLKIVIPSTPYDAKGLLKTAIRDNNPVIFFEHKLLYGKRGMVPKEEYTIPFGKAVIRRKGKDVTVVSWSYACHKVLEAAEKLSQENIEIEVIDPRTLFPFDKEALFQSIKKTNRLVIVEDGVKRGGVGSEIAGIVAEEIITEIDAPIKRVGAKDVPIPGSRYGEKFIVPSIEDIVKACKEVIF